MWCKTTGIPNHPLLLSIKLYCLITVSKRSFTHLFMLCLLVKHLVSTGCFSGQGTELSNKENTEMRETQPLPMKSFQSQRGHNTTKWILIKDRMWYFVYWFKKISGAYNPQGFSFWGKSSWYNPDIADSGLSAVTNWLLAFA